jgi:hypothetical protein
MRTARRAAFLPAAAALLTLMAACARHLDDPVGGEVSAPADVSAPTRFDADGRVRLPDEAQGLPDRVLFGVAGLPLPVVLSGTRAYIATHTALLAVDTRSGRTIATIGSADGRTGGWNPAGPPVLVVLDGEPTVVLPLLAGSGTAVELIGVQAATGRRLWSIAVDVDPGAVPAPPADREQWLAVLGVVGLVAVLRVGSTTYGIDLGGRKPVWREAGFTGAAIVGDVVVGWFGAGSTRRAAGLRAADGARRWMDRTPSPELSVTAGGPRFAVLQRQDGKHLRIVDAATGRDEALPAGVAALGSALACRYDGAGTTVCGAFWEHWNAAFDAMSGEWLWEIRAGTKGRTPIRLTAAWRGAVYGTEGGTRPVVLDARTGAVLERAPAAAPYLVNASVGVGPPVLGDGIYAYAVGA